MLHRIRQKSVSTLAALLLFTFLPLTSFAFGKAEEEPLVTDTRESWSCLFTELEGSNIEERHEYLLSSIPLLLFEMVEGIPHHRFSDEETEGRRLRLLELEVKSKEMELSQLFQKRDDYFLDGKRGELGKAGERIEEIRKEIEKLQSLRRSLGEQDKGYAELIETPKELPYVGESGEEGAKLSPAPTLPIEELAREKKADAILYGRLEQVEDALYLNLDLYLRDLDTSVGIYEGVLFPDRVEEAARAAARELTTRLIGREWAHLFIDIEPAHAGIFIGETSYAGGGRVLKYLKPGSFSYEVDAAGYELRRGELSLRNEEESSLQIELEAMRTATFTVETSPSGAELLSGAVPLGRSPIRIEDAVIPITILARKEGFYDYLDVLGEEPEGGSLSINLHPTSIGRERIVEAARSRFYKGVAGFFLSLPVTIISYGMSTEYAYAYNSSLENVHVTAQERSRLHGLSTVWYTAYLGGLFLNGVFLIDSIVQMRYYIRAAEGR